MFWFGLLIIVVSMVSYRIGFNKGYYEGAMDAIDYGEEAIEE